MMGISSRALADEVRAAIAKLKEPGTIEEIGVVTKVGDGVVWIYGLSACGYGEVVEIETGSDPQNAFVLNLLPDEIGAVLMGGEVNIKAGAVVKRTGKMLSVPVGEALLGRVVNVLGKPVDGEGPIEASEEGPLERTAPGVMDRQAVTQPLQTGILAIDAMIPIGLGQRELIIGDRQTGKTALAVDTMVNQAKQKTGVICIYVAVGQKSSKVARLVERLKAEGVMKQSIVVVSTASDPASLLYLAPYAGAAMGEYFRDKSQHALIIYDDLSKHAAAYRQMSLLLRRPPGREAYPGDVFYLHSRLLERSAKLSDSKGGGSLTALPIIETQAGDISAYIPTNVISITDGQIFMETDLFYQGVRPAISVGLSVSRVGGAAQTKAMKGVASSLRLALAQYRELAAFSQLSTDVDADTKLRIERGRRLTELLKQPPVSPWALWEEVAILTAANEGCFDGVELARLAEARSDVLRQLFESNKVEMVTINSGSSLSEEKKELIVKVAAKVCASYKETNNV